MYHNHFGQAVEGKKPHHFFSTSLQPTALVHRFTEELFAAKP